MLLYSFILVSFQFVRLFNQFILVTFRFCLVKLNVFIIVVDYTPAVHYFGCMYCVPAARFDGLSHADCFSISVEVIIRTPINETTLTAIYHRNSHFDVVFVEVVYCELPVQLCRIALYGFEINSISNSNAQRPNVGAGHKHVENLHVGSVNSCRNTSL